MSVQRAPIRRSIDVRARVTPPKPAPPEEKRRRRRPEPIATCGLVIVSFDGAVTKAHRSKPVGAWTAEELVDIDSDWRPLAELVSVINKGGRISYTSSGDWIISADQGRTFSKLVAPDNIFMHDRAPSGRYWTVGNGSGLVYFSDDEGAAWASSGSVIDFSTLWHISAHPTDPDRIAVTYSDSLGAPLMLRVTTNGGSSWSDHLISDNGEGYAVWLPSGRLVALVMGSELDVLSSDDMSRLYSDDDGVTWSAASLVVSNPVPVGSRLELTDVRVTRSGALFAIVNRETNVASLATLRSLDGDTFEVLDPHHANLAQAIAYCEATRRLFIAYREDHIYVIPSALTVDAGDWVSAGSELSGVPEDSVPVDTLHSYMVAI